MDAGFFINMAVREGFEPSRPCDLHTFQACSFDHSDTSPNLYSYCCTAGRFEMAGAARDLFTQNKEAKRDHMYADAYAFI